MTVYITTTWEAFKLDNIDLWRQVSYYLRQLNVSTSSNTNQRTLKYGAASKFDERTRNGSTTAASAFRQIAMVNKLTSLLRFIEGPGILSLGSLKACCAGTNVGKDVHQLKCW